MSIYPEKYGFVYIWYDRKHKRYYIGSHWGTEDDGYICSSRLMRQSYNRRPDDFKRRIIKRIYTDRKELLQEEFCWLRMIDKTRTFTHNKTPETRHNVRYYNIHLGEQDYWWSDDNTLMTVGEKISKANRGKKFGPRDPSVGQKISEVKKAKFEERQQKLGYKFSDEHKEKLADGRRDKPHSAEWKLENGKRMKEQWSNGTRKRAEPKLKMTKEEQAQLSANRLKDKWSDPVWKAKQQDRLKEGSRRRWNK